MNSFKDIHIWIHEHMNSYMNSTLWIHELLHLNKRLHATCLATSNLPMLSSSSGIINCSKVFTLPFILPILAMVCMLLIRLNTHISGWHPLAQGATGLDSFRPPNRSSVACASYKLDQSCVFSYLKVYTFIYECNVLKLEFIYECIYIYNKLAGWEFLAWWKLHQCTRQWRSEPSLFLLSIGPAEMKWNHWCDLQGSCHHPIIWIHIWITCII